MSIHKLTAGSGYDYLTRQVAALDATEKGHVPLATYYTERGETPGIWVGSGLAGIDGLQAGDPVTAEQMQALFGVGLHPLAVQRQQQLQGPDLTSRDYQLVTRLGAPFKIYHNDIPPFRVEVARRLADLNAAGGVPRDWPIPRSQRAKVRTEVASEFFTAEHGRPPQDAREIAAAIAKHSRPQTTAVAGYDLTFSPVKSVSTLWALAEPAVAAQIEKAHRAAVNDALAFIEQHALFSRTGTNGVRQVNVQGLVATAFTHRDSRAGDPDLHTHVAVANKVQTLDGRWLSIDGRILFKATVAASETYNTALENHLRDDHGLRFAERPDQDTRKRPVREIVGVHPALLTRWSTRRAAIEARRSVLAADFQRAHGRPPTPVEALQLAQQATLETREAKHQPRRLAEQRQAWFAEAAEVLGGPDAVQAMIRKALTAAASPARDVGAAWLNAAADQVLSAMEERRSTWQIWHVRAEAQRYIRAADVPTTQANRLLDLLVDEVLHRRSISLARPDGIVEPKALQRSDGASVYTVAGAELFTSRRILDAEQRLVVTAGRRDGHTIAAAGVDVALLEATGNGVVLNAGQTALVRDMATSGARLQLAIAPAGTGKTTALQALATAWRYGGGTVIGLAPSAAAAAVLRDQINTHTETLAKLTTSLHHCQLPGWVADVGPTTLVVIDEAGMADTLSLDAAVRYVVDHGGSVRLIGDDQQLAAIGAGGVLRDIQASHGAVRFTEPLRFTDPAEAAATLALRDGKPEAIGFYLDNRRVHVGDPSTITEQVFTSWQHDRSTGLDSIMLAPTRELVAELNRKARSNRLANTPPDIEVTLADGNRASVGELIITRSNDRQLRLTATDWVKNGDRWIVQAITDNGDLDVLHLRNRHRVRLPAAYVHSSAELGYATTVHAAQGVSVDTMHGLATGDESRQQLYTMLTRGRNANHLHLQVVGDGDPHSLIWPETIRQYTPTDILEQILARDDAARSATTLHRDEHDPALRLGEATRRYVDALHVAAEDLAGAQVVAALENAAEDAMPGLTDELAWPSLRGRLLLLAASGTDPVAQLLGAVDTRELGTADDRAAVLGWRLDDKAHKGAGFGPLPWLPAIPQRVHQHQTWAPYLAARAAAIAELADRVRDTVDTHQIPRWADQERSQPPSRLVRDVEVWRAAMSVSPDDQRPTGPIQRHMTARMWQRQLDQALGGSLSPAWQEWAPLIGQIAPTVRNDSFAPIVAGRLAALSRAGVNATQLLRTAVIGAALPDDHAAAALWWRICRHLPPHLSAQVNRDATFNKPWQSKLPSTSVPSVPKPFRPAPGGRR